MAAGPADAVLVVGLSLGRDRLAEPAVPDRPLPVRPAATDAGARRRRDAAVHRGLEPALARQRRAAQAAPRGGQGHGLPRHRLQLSQPVALHEPPLLGGGRDQPRRADRLAGPLPRPARQREQPAAGTGARLQPRALARHRHEPGGRGVGPRPVHVLRRRASTSPITAPMLNGFGELGELATSDPQLQYARGATAASSKLREDLAGLGHDHRAAGLSVQQHLRPPDGRAGHDALRRAAAQVRRAGGLRRLRHALGPGGKPARKHRRGRRRRSMPSSATSSSAARRIAS